MYPNDLNAVAVDLVAKLAAPNGALSVNSFLEKSGETVLVVHLAPKYRYLASRIPVCWKGVKVEYDIDEIPTLN